MSRIVRESVRDETWNEIWVWVHVATSLLWIAGYLIHLVSRRP